MIEITAEQAKEWGLDVEPGETVEVKVKPEQPAWVDCRAVMDRDGLVWSPSVPEGYWWAVGKCMRKPDELEKDSGPIRPLAAADGRVLLTDHEIEVVANRVPEVYNPPFVHLRGAIAIALGELHGTPEDGAGDPR